MVVARTGVQTEEQIRWVTLGRPESSRLFDVRVQRYWNQWTLVRRLFAVGWGALTLMILVAAVLSGWLRGSRLLAVPLLLLLGYLGYRVTRSRWPGDFHTYVSSRDETRRGA
jgi:hypothetical protein